MIRTVDLDQVRVYQVGDRKGSPQVVLEIMDEPILFASAYDLVRHDVFSKYVRIRNEPDPAQGIVPDFEVATDALADMFRIVIARILQRAIRAELGDLVNIWTTRAEDDVIYGKPRFDED